MAVTKLLHTRMRVNDIEKTVKFYEQALGLKATRRHTSPRGAQLVFLATPADAEKGNGDGVPMVELTYNWDEKDYGGGRNFGHLAYRVDDIYAVCKRLMDGGVTINRPPRDGHMAFVRSPDGISIELLQEGGSKPPQEPWVSMPNVGSW